MGHAGHSARYRQTRCSIFRHAWEALAAGQYDIAIGAKDRNDEIGVRARTVEVFRENALKVRQLEEEKLEAERLAQAEKRGEMENLAKNFESTVTAVVGALANAAGRCRFPRKPRPMCKRRQRRRVDNRHPEHWRSSGKLGACV